MPVADHPVHESTKRADNRPACYDKREPLSAGFWARDGWDQDYQHPFWIWVPHKMTTNCQSDLDLCVGCKDFKGENNG